MSAAQLTRVDNDRVEWDADDADSLLGRGAFGTVYKGTMDGTTDVAIKVITRCPTDNPEHELRLMRHLIHPNIVQFLTAACSPKSNQTVIVTELLHGGSLHEALECMRASGRAGNEGAVLSERSFLQIGVDIANGLLYLHNSRYTHGDMKPHNVLLTSPVELVADGTEAVFQKNVRAKIADFGLSRSIGKQTKDKLIASTNTPDFGPGPVGTFAYMSPQAFDGIANMDGNVAKAADVYALAIVVFELLSGRQPWKAEGVVSVFNLHHLVCNDRRRPAWGPREDGIRKEYMEFVERCWADEWRERPTAEEVAKQFRAWSMAFQRREAGRSPGSAGTSTTTPSTSSPVAGRREVPATPEGARAGVPGTSGRSAGAPGGDVFDSVGNGEFTRVNTEVVDEDEAKRVRRRVARDPIDIGGSTNTSIRDSGGSGIRDSRDDIGASEGGYGASEGGYGASVGGIPPIPEEEVSEYSVAPVPEQEPSEYDAPAAPPSTFLSNPIGGSGLDLLRSEEFNNMLVPVETRQLLIPDVDPINLVMPTAVPPRNAPAQAPAQGAGLSLALDAAGGKGVESNRKNMHSSFMGAAAKYNEDSDAPKANGGMNGFLDGVGADTGHGGKANGAGTGHELLDSFDRADAMYSMAPDGALGLNGLNLGNGRKSEDKAGLADSFFGAAQRHTAHEDGNGNQESAGKSSLADSFFGAAERHIAHEEANGQQAGGGKNALADSFFGVAQRHNAHEEANGYQNGAVKAGAADSFFGAAQRHNAHEEANGYQNRAVKAGAADSFFGAAQRHKAHEEANGYQNGAVKAGAADSFFGAAQRHNAHEEVQDSLQNGFLAPGPAGAPSAGGKEHKAGMEFNGDHDASSRKSSLENARKQPNGVEPQGKPGVELPSVKIELPNAAPVLENGEFVGNMHGQYEVTSNGVQLNAFPEQQPATMHGAPFFAQPVPSVSPPQHNAHHQPVSSVSPPQHSAPMQHQIQPPPVSQHANHHNQPITYGPGMFQPYGGHDINMSFVSGGNWGYPDPRTAIGGAHRPAALPTWNGACAVAPLSEQTAISAFASQDAAQRLEQYWQAGHRAVLASAFVHVARRASAVLTANLHLVIALRFVKLNNSHIPCDPLVARDLCVGVGLMAMNTPGISGSHALEALQTVLATMHYNPRDAAVHTASCFALCNLLQINNRMEKPELRKAVADWIVFALAEAVSNGEKNGELAYTACCAARNFMWMNEANADAFVGPPEMWRVSPPLQKLIGALRDFRDEDQVLEAGISALATAAYFPMHRQRIVENNGVQELGVILRHAPTRANTARMCLSILELLVAEPGPGSAEEHAEVRKALLSTNVPSVVLNVLHIASQQRLKAGSLALLAVEEEALSTVVALCGFDADVANAVTANKAGWLLFEAMTKCAPSPASPSIAPMLASFVCQLCEAVAAVAGSKEGIQRLVECGVLRRMEALRATYSENAQVVGVVGRVAGVLKERMLAGGLKP